MKKIRVVSSSQLECGGKHYRCAIGKAGFAGADEKREGDLKTPMGTYALRELWYRPDKLTEPFCGLPTRIITTIDGWCDDPSHGDYNRYILIPAPMNMENSPPVPPHTSGGREFADAPFSFERLHRDDDVYDLIVPLGYNDNPPVAGRGSAIFLHVAKPDYAGTEGCVALAKLDLLEILAKIELGDAIEIAPA